MYRYIMVYMKYIPLESQECGHPIPPGIGGGGGNWVPTFLAWAPNGGGAGAPNSPS